MSDVELVIKIPEDIVTDIKDHCGMSIADAKEVLPIILNAIHSGTLLPKVHGDLVDVDKFIGKIHGVKSITAVLDAEVLVKADKEYEAKVITRGNCMMCGKELTEGLFFCKGCGDKVSSKK